MEHAREVAARARGGVAVQAGRKSRRPRRGGLVVHRHRQELGELGNLGDAGLVEGRYPGIEANVLGRIARHAGSAARALPAGGDVAGLAVGAAPIGVGEPGDRERGEGSAAVVAAGAIAGNAGVAIGLADPVVSLVAGITAAALVSSAVIRHRDRVVHPVGGRLLVRVAAEAVELLEGLEGAVAGGAVGRVRTARDQERLVRLRRGWVDGRRLHASLRAGREGEEQRRQPRQRATGADATEPSVTLQAHAVPLSNQTVQMPNTGPPGRQGARVVFCNRRPKAPPVAPLTTRGRPWG